MTTAHVGIDDVRAVRAGLGVSPEDCLVYEDEGQVVLEGHGVRETYDTAEEAIAGLRASWGVQS